MTLGQLLTTAYAVAALATWVAVLPTVDRWGNGPTDHRRSRGDHATAGFFALIPAAVWPLTLAVWIVYEAFARLVPAIINRRSS